MNQVFALLVAYLFLVCCLFLFVCHVDVARQQEPLSSPIISSPPAQDSIHERGVLNVTYIIVADRVDSHRNLCFLFHSIIRHKWPRLYVLGWDRNDMTTATSYASILRKESAQFHTFMLGSKLTLMLRFLESVSDPNRLFLVTDAYDVVLQQDYDEFLAKYQPDQRVLFSTEHDCWPPSFIMLYPSTSSSSSLEPIYHHLNSGGYVGTASAIQRMLREAIRDDRSDFHRHHLYFRLDSNQVVAEGERAMVYVNVTDPDNVSPASSYRVPGVYKRNDQIIFSMLYFDGAPFNISLDKGAHIFQSMQLSRENLRQHITFINGTLVNRVTGNIPTFVHYNGPSKSWDDSFSPFTMKCLQQAHHQPQTAKDLNADNRIIILDRFMKRVYVDISELCSEK